jgi:hypothetical protein
VAAPRQPQLPDSHENRGVVPPREGREPHPVTSTRVVRLHNQESQIIPTSGEILHDGSFLELVRDPRDNARTLLLHWNEGKSTIAREFASDGRLYAPTGAASLIEHLPSKPAPYRSTEALFNGVADFIARYSGSDKEEAALLAFVCFASFFCDCSSMAPCLLLFGAPIPAVSLLRVMGCVCRHPVLSAGSSVIGLPAELRPTRLICQPDARLDRELAALQLSGFRVPGQGLRQISGASIVYAGDTDLKSPFAEVCLQLRVSPTSCSFGLQEEELEIVRINKLQNQLLMYRLKNYSNVKASQFDVPEFSGATREVARTLGQCIVGAPGLQSRLTTLLRSRDDAERTESTSKLEAVVLEALVVCCHERKASVHVGEIATLANGILSRSGEPVELSPKQTGGKMKGLGLRTTKVDSGGRGIYLLSEQCARIHELGRAFSVPALREGLPGCPYCRKN